MIPAFNASNPLTVLVVDSQPLMQASIRLELQAHPDIQVIASAATPEQALDITRRLRPRMILFNLIMPALDLQNTLTDLLDAGKRRSYMPMICVYSAFRTYSYIMAALEAGASGYLNTENDGINLVTMIRTVARGEGYENDDMIRARNGFTFDGISRLTRAERGVLRVMATGADNDTISQDLQIAVSTVKKHASNIFKKLSVENRAEAISFVLRYHIIDL
ncbi:MAG: response regulator transcription factor [bacterium]|nr:response regulator transcription factor [bacterium]